MDLLLKLSNSPVPNVLVISGVVFILLAVVGKIGATLSVPQNRQRMSAVVGTSLLVCGIIVFMLPDIFGLIEPGHTNGGGGQGSSEYIDKDRVRNDIRTAHQYSSDIQARALYDVNEEPLSRYFSAGALKTLTERIEYLRGRGLYQKCYFADWQYHDIDIQNNYRNAVVDVTETWDCAFYREQDNTCAAEYRQPLLVRQKLYFEKQGKDWMVVSIENEDQKLHEDLIGCSEKWQGKGRH